MNDCRLEITRRKRGGVFPPGNPGRPRGARHKTTLLAQRLMQCEAQAIVSVVVEAAKDTVEAAAGRSGPRTLWLATKSALRSSNGSGNTF